MNHLPRTKIMTLSSRAVCLSLVIGLVAFVIAMIQFSTPAFGDAFRQLREPRPTSDVQPMTVEGRPQFLLVVADKDVDPTPAAGRLDDATLQQLELQRDVLQKGLALANEEIEKQVRDFEKLDVDSADLTNQESQLDDLRQIIKRIGTQLSLWNLELEAEQRTKVVEMASRPQGDDALMRDVQMGVAGIVGFSLVGGIMLLASRSPRRRVTRALRAGIVVGALLAFAVWVLVPVHYEAQALIRVSKILPVVLQNVVNGGIDEGANYDVYKKTQLQLLRSNFVLSRAARRSEMVSLPTMQEHKDDPVGFLESRLIVDYPADAELLRVAIKGTRRDDLPVIVNSVVDSYMEEIVNADKVARLKQKDLLVQAYSNNQEAFRTKSEKFKKLANEVGASSSEATRIRKRIAEQRLDASVASANALRQRIRDVELQILLLKESKPKAADGAPLNPVPDLLVPAS